MGIKTLKTIVITLALLVMMLGCSSECFVCKGTRTTDCAICVGGINDCAICVNGTTSSGRSCSSCNGAGKSTCTFCNGTGKSTCTFCK